MVGPILIDPADSDSLDSSEAARPRPSSPLPSGSAGDARHHAEIDQRLKRLSGERLAHVVMRLAERHREDVLRILDEIRGQAPDSLAASHAEDAEAYMVGSSAAMHRVFDSIRKFAATDAPVLITGESGTGKELVARAIHERSAYRGGPFVAISCAALPATLIAAELFGHEKGALAEAVPPRIGRLESAHGGTIFLDDLDSLPLEQQMHLLRFLEERTIDRVGGTWPVEVDARVVCATGAHLAKAVRDGRFREDLYYRLHVLHLHLPSLRERGDDIELLATFFLRKFTAEHGRNVQGFSDDVWRRMREHSWPGNVRELISRIRRAVVMADAPFVTATDMGLDDAPSRLSRSRPFASRGGPLIDEQRLREALNIHDNSVTRVARALGISRMTVYRSMRRYGIVSR